MKISGLFCGHPVRFAVLAAYLGIAVSGPFIHALQHGHAADGSVCSARLTESVTVHADAQDGCLHAHCHHSHHRGSDSHSPQTAQHGRTPHQPAQPHHHDHDDCPVCQAIAVVATLQLVSEVESHITPVIELLNLLLQNELPVVLCDDCIARGPPAECSPSRQQRTA